jgi:hypothetical protein
MRDKATVGKSGDVFCDIGKKDNNSQHDIVVALQIVSMTKTERILKLLQGR